MHRRCSIAGAAALAVGLWVGATVMAADGFVVGVDANYVPGMEAKGRQWRWEGEPTDFFTGAAARGVRGFRVRLWARDDGPNGRHEATDVVRRALAAGLDPYLVIFLSDEWADLMKQPAPAAWRDLAIDARAAAVRAYSRDTVRHFRSAGLRSHRYEIGNEIDYGICGVYPAKSAKKNPDALRRRCWPDAAALIAASQQGVLEADPDATFLLHVAHWWDAEFCVAFFRFMLDHGVRVDEIGLSYFPSANIGGSLEMEQFGAVAARVHETIGRPVVVAETAYPATRDFTGQFGRWKRETPGYPLTPDGQRRWLADFLAFCRHHPAVTDVYYWSPEWWGEGMWNGFALFDEDGSARPAWRAFAAPGGWPQPRRTVFLEVTAEGVAVVPTAAARVAAATALEEELARHGGVTTAFIDAITNRAIVVKGYRLHLRAALTGNLGLSVTPEAGRVPHWRAVVNALDPSRDQVVVFTGATEDPLAGEVVAHATSRGVAAVTHAVDPDTPLRFGSEPIRNDPPR